MIIEMSLPPDVLHPNASNRIHWGTKSKARKKRRRAVRMYAMVACGGNPPRWEKAQAWARFYFAKPFRGDALNLPQWMKSDFDGLQDAGIVENDRGITLHATEVYVDPNRPRLEIEIQEIPSIRSTRDM